MLTYRLDKGAPLTLEEMDGNFKELEDRLGALESHLEDKEGVGRLLCEGSSLKVIGTRGTELDVLSLPTPSFQARGIWVGGSTYAASDFVVHQEALYSCLHPHVSRVWEDDAAFWQEVFRTPQRSLSLPLYERGTLPAEEKAGKLALLMEEDGSRLVFFNGVGWEALPKGERV